MNEAGTEITVRNLYFLPQFLEEPEGVLTMVNESVALSVVVDGSPFPYIQWQRLNNGMFIDQSDENQSTLQFPSIGYSDAGVYRCMISSTVNGSIERVTSRKAIVSGVTFLINYHVCYSLLYFE